MLKRLLSWLIIASFLAQPVQAAVPTAVTDLSTTASSNSPAGSEAIGTSLDDYLRAGYAFTRQLYDTGIIWGGTSSGTNTITFTASPAPTAYKTGQGFAFIAGGANTGAATANANGIGAVAIKKNGTTALSSGDIPSGALVIIVYDGTNFQLINPLLSTSGLLQAANNLTDVSSTSSALSNLGGVATTRTISAAGLATGGGDLSANRTVTVTAATQSDMETGTSTTTAVTPAVAQHNPGVAKAWVMYNASTTTVLASYNVSSVTHNGAGDITVNFTTSFSSADYAVSGVAAELNTAVNFDVNIDSTHLPTASACRLLVINGNSGAKTDTSRVSLVFFGDQ